MHQNEIKEEFCNYATASLKLNPQNQLLRVVKFTTKIFVDEYLLSIQEKKTRDDFADCVYFANVKSSLLFHWETEIVAKSSNFKKNNSY